MSRDRRPPQGTSRAYGRYNYPRRHSKKKDKQTYPVDCRATSPTTQERDSLKSQGRGWPRGPLGDWDLSRKCEGCLKPADRRKRISKLSSDLSRLNIGNTLTLEPGLPSHPGRR
ncbi:hypothetical protein ACMD2_11558 [Ananas comosus]|uniref:Uncharacterized protein n=1 Tax=Ananas comosus TaxID=4615 RepID=A0A199VDZ5_ANACO|nr:hypothetical protein ACMD2_11558 [Ananas comosus]